MVVSIEISETDFADADPTAKREFWELGRDAVADRPYNTFAAWEAARVYLGIENPDVRKVFLVARDDGRLVGSAGIMLWLSDNTHRAYVDVAVQPDRRREGLGTRLLDRAVAIAQADGRRVVSSEIYAPVDGASPATAFAERHGFRVTLEDGMKVVDIAATRGSWDALAAEAARHHADYELRTVQGAIPEELVAGHLAINNMFVSEAPSGDADIEDENWDEARLRAHEERAAKAGRRDFTTYALAADGQVVALTEAFLNEHVPHRGFQGGTLVVPGHRGRRLGLAVKVANQRAMVEAFPELAWIVTGNADVNVHMNAVNDRLGFTVVERCLEVEKAV